MKLSGDNDSREPDAPRKLVEELRALHGRVPGVPVEVDRAVLAMARRRLRARRRPVPALRWALAGAVAGAAALLAVGIVLGPLEGLKEARLASAPPAAPKLLKEDLDGSGRVDILDAFLLARHIDAGSEPEGEWDFSGDGAVDRRDVDALAQAAVRLDRGML